MYDEVADWCDCSRLTTMKESFSSDRQGIKPSEQQLRNAENFPIVKTLFKVLSGVVQSSLFLSNFSISTESQMGFPAAEMLSGSRSKFCKPSSWKNNTQ